MDGWKNDKTFRSKFLMDEKNDKTFPGKFLTSFKLSSER